MADIISINPNFARTYYLLGFIAEAEGSLQEAIEYLEQSLDIDSHFFPAQGKLKVWYERLYADKDTAASPIAYRAQITETYDDMLFMTVFWDKGNHYRIPAPRREQDTVSSLALYFIKPDWGKPELRLSISYVGPRNLMIEEFLFRVDERRFSIQPLAYEMRRSLEQFPFTRRSLTYSPDTILPAVTVQRYHAACFVEVYDVPVTQTTYQILRALSNARAPLFPWGLESSVILRDIEICPLLDRMPVRTGGQRPDCMTLLALAIACIPAIGQKSCN